MYNDPFHISLAVPEPRMPCPFFMPTAKFENGAWPHPARLPLGCGWTGHCTAPQHQGEIPDALAIEQFCNLGYAAQCNHFPQERAWDAVRFGVSRAPVRDSQSAASTIRLRYVCERDHVPADSGVLEFDLSSGHCLQPHPDPRVQKMAECFLESYIQKIRRGEHAPAN